MTVWEGMAPVAAAVVLVAAAVMAVAEGEAKVQRDTQLLKAAWLTCMATVRDNGALKQCISTNQIHQHYFPCSRRCQEPQSQKPH